MNKEFEFDLEQLSSIMKPSSNKKYIQQIDFSC